MATRMVNEAMDEDGIKAEARRWLLRLSLEQTTPEEREQFAAWCALDARHAAAYQRVESIWQDAAKLEDLAALARVESGPPRAWWRFVSWGLWGVGIAAAAALVIIGVRLVPSEAAHYATGVAQVQEIHLPDGTDITLGARSSLEVAFGAQDK